VVNEMHRNAVLGHKRVTTSNCVRKNRAKVCVSWCWRNLLDETNPTSEEVRVDHYFLFTVVTEDGEHRTPRDRSIAPARHSS
jgi:hypothetical protein